MEISEVGVSEVNNILSVGAIIFTTLSALIIFVWKYLKSNIQREKLANISDSFYKTVLGLSSNKMSEKIASAVLLRRFFDENTEFGLGNTPFKKDSINVIAGLLRYESTSDFQKLLGDGLAYAPSLENADLQKTNLQNVFLSHKNKIIDISGADFYGADLSKASLSNTKAIGCVFFEARLNGTVFKKTNLTNANFGSSDLTNVNFKEAVLDGADFSNAINIPDEVIKHLDENGKFCIEKQSQAYEKKMEKKVFLCVAGILNPKQLSQYNLVINMLQIKGVSYSILERTSYQYFGVTGEINKRVRDSMGTIVFGFSDIQIKNGIYRKDTIEEKDILDKFHISPWVHTEIGVVLGNSKPLLIMHESCIDIGLLEEIISEVSLEKIDLDKSKEIEIKLDKWLGRL